MTEEKKKEDLATDDVLLKLTMPGQSLREETLQKGKDAQTRFLQKAQHQQGASPTQPPQHLEPNPDEDILTKLAMPGQSLREETLQKIKEIQSQPQNQQVLPKQHLAPSPDDDILTKLTMPGQSLRDETLHKMKTAEEKYHGQREIPQQLEAAPEDILQKVSKPTISSSEPQPQQETPRTEIGGSIQRVDVTRVQQLAESIFSSDFSFGKRKK